MIRRDRLIAIVTSERFLFALVFGILLIRIGGLFQNSQLPGADGASHFLALEAMATQFLPHGALSGYFPLWLGGISLFTFYGPFYFAAVSALWLVTGQLIPLALLFRLSIFAILCGIPVSLWYFLKTFFDRDTARWGIPLSLLFLFYPKVYSGVGVGIGATIWIGLIPNTLGIIEAMLWLSFLEKFRVERSFRYLALATVAGLTLLLTHTLMFVAGLLSVLTYLAYYYTDRDLLKKCILSFLSLGLLSAFWLMPFLSQLELAASDTGRIGNSIVDPLLVLFPLNPLLLLHPSHYAYVEFWVILFFVALAVGLYTQTFKNENKSLSFLFLIWWVFIARDYLPTVFPNLGLHYQRLVAFLFLLALALAAYGLETIWRTWATNQRRKQLFIFLFALVLIQSQIGFDHGTNDFNSTTRELISFHDPLTWTLDEQSRAAEGKELLTKIGKLPAVERLFVAIPYAEAFVDFGSLHYFTSQIPIQNKQAVLNGLYVESSPLTPFIIPTLDALTDRKELLVIGDVRLKAVETFYKQPLKTQLLRLQKLGLSHLIVQNSVLAKTISAEQSEVQLIDRTKNFFIFSLRHPKPLVHPASHRPGLYLNEDHEVSFRDLAITLFAGQKTFDFPVVEAKNSLATLTPETVKDFSILIVGGKTLTSSSLNHLITLNHPTIILNPSEEIELKLIGQKNILPIRNFETIPKGLESHFEQGPYTWASLLQWLGKTIEPYAEKNPTSTPLQTFTDRTIQFTSHGPTIINAGYSPYWQCTTGCTHVYQVSPANMLVFATGETVLTYQADTVKKVSVAISWISLIILSGITVKNWRSKRRHKTTS